MQHHHHTHEVYSLRPTHLQLHYWIKGIQKIINMCLSIMILILKDKVSSTNNYLFAFEGKKPAIVCQNECEWETCAGLQVFLWQCGGVFQQGRQSHN